MLLLNDDVDVDDDDDFDVDFDLDLDNALVFLGIKSAFWS
jgi:hypothetical protein